MLPAHTHVQTGSSSAVPYFSLASTATTSCTALTHRQVNARLWVRLHKLLQQQLPALYVRSNSQNLLFQSMPHPVLLTNSCIRHNSTRNSTRMQYVHWHVYFIKKSELAFTMSLRSLAASHAQRFCCVCCTLPF